MLGPPGGAKGLSSSRGAHFGGDHRDRPEVGLGFRVFGLKGLAFRAARVARDRPPPTNSDNKGSWT